MNAERTNTILYDCYLKLLEKHSLDDLLLCTGIGLVAALVSLRILENGGK